VPHSIIWFRLLGSSDKGGKRRALVKVEDDDYYPEFYYHALLTYTVSLITIKPFHSFISS
jgi:hypothetical protein